MSIFYQPNAADGNYFLDPEESRHAIKVLRLKVGDEIMVIDGKGTFYKAEITDANAKKCGFRIIEKLREKSSAIYIHIAIAPTKNIDRLEWFVEKVVEIGVDEISFIICHNSERRVLKTDRIVKKAISAMKQSIKATLPIINEPVKVGSFIKQCSQQNKYIAYVDFENPDQLANITPKEADYCILIGPEGDFSSSEVDEAIAANFKKVGLGPSRLRTETAALVACHTLHLINR